MKIAFIGSHGVGKTTLCYELAAVLKKQRPSVDIVKEAARLCPLPINRSTTLAAQSWILHTQIAMEIVSVHQHDIVICDRSVLDNYAYLVAAKGRHTVLDRLITYWMASYDYLFKVPLGTGLQEDGVRDLDAVFQREIDGIVDGLLSESSLYPYRLSAASRSRWMNHILKAMEMTPASAERKGTFPSFPQQMSLPIAE